MLITMDIINFFHLIDNQYQYSVCGWLMKINIKNVNKIFKKNSNLNQFVNDSIIKCVHVMAIQNYQRNK